MENSSPVDQQERILRARIALSLRQPFLSSALMRLPLKNATAMSWCSTMATDGYHIFFDANWVSKLTMAELRGVLAHEVLHVIFQHGSRRKNRDGELWNIAGDHAINLLLLEQGFALPTGGIADSQYLGQATEEIYASLIKRIEKNVRENIGPCEESETDDGPGQVPKIGADLIDPDDPRATALRDRNMPDSAQLDDLCAELRTAAHSKLQGNCAAWFHAECVAIEESKIDWRALLREWLQDRIRSDWSLWPYSKKHIHRGFMLPSVGVEAPGHLVFAIDTSGSMSDDDLGKAVSELRAYRETFPCRLTVIQADAAVHSVETFEELDGTEIPKRMPIIGRGGTDFRPVFSWVDEFAPSAIVVFVTDGFGTFPKHQAGSHVIWLLVGNHIQLGLLPFGESARIC